MQSEVSRALLKGLRWLVIAGLLTPGASGFMNAQEAKPPGGPGFDERLLELAPSSIPALAPYLQLTKEQQAKFQQVQQAYMAGLQSVHNDSSLTEDQKFEKSSALTEDTTKKMLAALSEPQRQKILPTLTLFASLYAVRIPVDLAGDLKLTPDQQTQVVSLAQQLRQQMHALALEDRMPAKGFAMLKDFNGRAQALLTPEQKAVLGADPAKATLANPASVNCGKRGGKTVIRKNADGSEYGVCVFPNGAECEEWALFRRQCSHETAKKP